MNEDQTNLLTFDIPADGNLHIGASQKARKIIQEMKDGGVNTDSAAFFINTIEHFLCNGWTELRPKQTGDLTSSIVLAKDEDCEWDDVGNLTNDPRRFWFPNYQVRSPMQDLLDSGECLFEVAK